MHLLTLPLSSNSHVYTEGDVSVDPSAAIAPGVILRAAPDSNIIIAAGVCIGMGSILHAYQGTLEVEAGANLGAGVLIFGKGKIGANACIGAVTTISNASVEPWQVVPAASVLGDKGRQVVEDSPAATSSPSQETPSIPESSGEASANGRVPVNPIVGAGGTTSEGSPTETEATSPASEAETTVYGQGSLDRILKTLFPYNNQSLNRSTEDG